MTSEAIAAAFAFTAGTVAGFAAVRSYLGARKLRAMTHKLNSRINQAASDRAFARWATWTMLTVTDAQGYVHAATLRQLYTTGQWDQVWDAPAAVSLWHGDPDTVLRFEREMDMDQEGGHRG